LAGTKPILTMNAETPPASLYESQGEALVAHLSGDWTVNHAPALESMMAEMVAKAVEAEARLLRADISGLGKLDTLGALVISKLRHTAGSDGLRFELAAGAPFQLKLIEEVDRVRAEPVIFEPRPSSMQMLVDVGEAVVNFWRDLVKGTSFLGEVVVATGRALANPGQFRGPSLINHIEQIGFRGAPITILISFLVGCIVAQQGIFQLQRFGATPFVVNLVGILILRELAVLLTSIMVAGRSGSAFTAEIGSMKMREEIDALRVMGLDPVAVLVVPRILALLIALPLLTFLSSIAALIGAGLVAWSYGGITPEIFITRLQSVVTAKHFAVGMIKAPFMALMIGLIASLEGMAVKGSAESLGRQVTSSVVKAIFMVIVVDGLFAMFFAAIRF
jgi:phospholipid/cholesterol/gamma-HCH transport system permease protein